MPRILPPILAAVLLASLPSGARADGSAERVQDRRSSFSVGVFGGGHVFADKANLGVSSAPDASAGARSHALGGLRAGVGLRAWAAAEVEIIGMLTMDRTYERRASILGYRVNLVAFLLPGNLRPFALAGAGVLEVASTRADGQAGLVRDRDGEFHVGGGLDYRLLEHLCLRVDARAVQVPGKPVWSLATDLEASLGIAVLFGAGPRPAASPTTAMPIPVASVEAKPVLPARGPLAATAAAASPPVAAAARPPSAAVAKPADRARALAGKPPAAGTRPSPASSLAPAVPPSPPSPVSAPAAPRLAAMAPTPRPTIPASRGRPPSLAELLGRAREIRFDGSFSSKLSLVSLPLLGQLAEALAKDPAVQVEIVAHTAGSGDAAKDLALSQRRADAVKRALVEREVSASRLLSTGRGSVAPLAPNVTRSGRRLNERVELRVWTPERMVR